MFGHSFTNSVISKYIVLFIRYRLIANVFPQYFMIGFVRRDRLVLILCTFHIHHVPFLNGYSFYNVIYIFVNNVT